MINFFLAFLFVLSLSFPLSFSDFPSFSLSLSLGLYLNAIFSFITSRTITIILSFWIASCLFFSQSSRLRFFRFILSNRQYVSFSSHIFLYLSFWLLSSEGRVSLWNWVIKTNHLFASLPSKFATLHIELFSLSPSSILFQMINLSFLSFLIICDGPTVLYPYSSTQCSEFESRSIGYCAIQMIWPYSTELGKRNSLDKRFLLF